MFDFLAKLPTGIEIFGFEIRFYAIFILVGALLALFLAIVYNKKQGTFDPIFENVFYVAFPAGIVGARIWYVIAEWNKEFAGRDFWNVFKIWEGGLAIHGGILLGVVVGMIYLYKKKPHLNTIKIANVIIPCILLSQAIGRLGNFFNGEVYGYCIDAVEASSYLPQFIIEQMSECTVPGTGQSACVAGQIPLPLFLIEGLINIAGFFIIMYAVRFGLKKYLKDGDLIGCYFIWYGTIRAILEPLRHPAYQMGKNLTSVWMSIAFIILGIAIIVLCHVFADKIENHFANNKAKYELSLKGETKEESEKKDEE